MKALIRVVVFFLVIAAITFAWLKLRPVKNPAAPASADTTEVSPTTPAATPTPAASTPLPVPSPTTVPEVAELPADDAPRTWTSRDGRTMTARYISSTDTTVTVRRSDDVVFTIPLANLSTDDSDWIALQPRSEKTDAIATPAGQSKPTKAVSP